MEELLATGFLTNESEEFKKFARDCCTLVDWNHTLNTKFDSKAKFYLYKDVVFDEYLLSGHFKNRSIRLNDSIVISSFPKTGSTWCQELAYCVLNGDDLSKSDEAPLLDRAPFLEFLGPLTVDEVNRMPTPKLFKTHLTLSLLRDDYGDKNYKIIYVMRNPKDALVSFYFFSKMNKLYQFSGTISEYVDVFVNDLVVYGPFAKHVLEFWEKSKTDDNILFLQYEHLISNLKRGVEKIAQFLGKDLDDGAIEEIVNRCSFSSMSANPMTNLSHLEGVVFDSKISKFMRKGKVGDWKNHLSEDDNRKVDEWIEKNFGNSDLKFTYE